MSWVPFLILVSGVGALRLYYCTLLPISTGDLARHLFHGLLVLRDGLGSAGVALAETEPSLAQLSWAELPYNYPPLTLLFFTLLSAIAPTLFVAKAVLTAMEGVNAWLIGRYTGQRWLGALYWASPASIWWVSREGQFEPLHSLFLIAAIVILRRQRPLAFLMLAFAIQVKILAILMLPWFVAQVWPVGQKTRAASIAAFLIGFLPSILAGTQYSLAGSLGITAGSLRYNPYFWNFLDPAIFLWNPLWLVVINQIASFGLVILLLLRARGSEEPITFFGPVSFVVLVKGSLLAQFWYFLMFPAFVLPLQERRLRFWLIALTPLLDVYSLAQIIVGPFGWTMSEYWAGFDGFRPFLLP